MNSLPKTDIPWASHQWPILRGCSPVSEGCQHTDQKTGRVIRCYAGEWFRRFEKHMHIAPWGHPTFLPENLDMPLRTRKPARVFVAPMSDFFHEKCEPIWQDKAGLVMAKCIRHCFMVLTKRPKNIQPWINRMIDDGLWPMSNLWLGVSAENQERAEERIPILLSIPAAVHFVSCEPLLSSIDLRRWIGSVRSVLSDRMGHNPGPYLDLVIAGPETGPGKRPCRDEWIDSLAEECAKQRIPFFDKRTNWKRREWPEGH